MVKNKTKVLFFDIDGTIFDYKNNCIPLKTISAFKRLKEKGYVIVIATGRCFAQLDLLKPIKEYIDYYVLANGQHIINSNGSIIKEYPYLKEDLNNLVLSFERLDLGYGLQGEKEEVINSSREDVLELLKRCNLPLPKVNNKFHLNNKVYQAWVIASENDKKILEEENPNFLFVPWTNGAYDIMLKGINKARGVEEIKTLYKNCVTYAFGDNYNDVPMLDLADYKALIKNDHFKDESNKYYHANEVSKDGLYEALKCFDLI